MKIIYLSTADIPSRKANSVHIMKMCAAFANNGHDVTLFAPSSKNTTEDKSDVFEYYGVVSNFRIKRIWYPQIRFGGYIYALCCLITVLRMKPDLIFSRNLLSFYFSCYSGKPGILEIHYPVPEKSRLQSKMFRKILSFKNFKKLIEITRPLKKIYLAKYPSLKDEKIMVAADGADLPAKDPLKFSNYNERMQIGYIGHLYQGRGIDLILGLAKLCLWADFHIVGGTEKDIERVRSQSEEIPNVKVHGFIAPAEAEIFRGRMDILLAPYQKEVGLESGDMTTEKWMSPLKIFEYMAAGKAIICSDIPVLREVLIDQKNCILCPPADTESWRKALIKLHEDEIFRQQIANQAYQDLKTKYQWTTRARLILEKANVKS